MKKFHIIDNFSGYRNKTDVTNLGEGYLVVGSKNVISTDGERIAARKGYTLDGAANSTLFPIVSSFEWQTHWGLEIPLRSYDDELEYRFNNTWYRLKNLWSSVSFNFATFWDTTAVKDKLLFVNGSSNVYEWSGGITTYSSSTVNTITKQGATTWGENGFTSTGSIVIGGITYTYTGGAGTTTLTGVTPDPTTGGHSAGDVVHQTVVTNANTAITGLPNTFNNDLIEVFKNQVWIGDLKNRNIYVSKVDNLLNFSFTSPVRLIGEGASLTLNNTPVGFVVSNEDMYITAGKSDWYRTRFVVSDTLDKESIFINKLNSDPQEAAIVQSAISKVKDQIIFINNEPALMTLGQVENISTPQSRRLSDQVKNDFNDFDFTNAHIKFFKNNIYIAVPQESLVLIYNVEREYWEAPQVLPIRRLAIINGELYGHSNSVPETYKLFNGTNDNGKPINSAAAFSYINFGRRDWKKNFHRVFVEGYISSNTTLTMNILYDYQSATLEKTYDILGSDSAILFNPVVGGAVGKFSLGKSSIGGGAGVPNDMPKFRHVKQISKRNAYEIQFIFSSDDIDQQWELLAFGPNALLSKADNIEITK